MRVAVRVQEAGLGGQQRSPAVHVYRTAFHDDRWIEHREAELTGDPCGYDIVQIVRWILAAPRIEVPIDDGLCLVTGVALDEDRAMIPAPGVVGWMVVEEHVAAAGTLIREKTADLVL